MKSTRYQKAIDDAKRRQLVSALKRHGTCRAAGKELGISPATVSRECRRLGITVQTSRVVEVA